jgi:type II secretory pathway component GspD/PulD (secretin)
MAVWAVGLCVAQPSTYRVSAVAPPITSTVTPAPKPEVKKEAPKKKAGTIAFTMSGRPWKEVFKWLSDLTDKPYVAPHMPTGTCNITSPKGKRYTVGEVIDLINEALLAHELTQKYYLINRERSYTLVPASEKIDPSLIPRIRLEDLEDRGRSELVSLVVPLKTLEPEDVAPEVKGMMGPFGTVTPLSKAKQLLMQDTVGNLDRIVKTLKDIEKEENKGDELRHECKWIKASEAERILKQLLGDPAELAKLILASAPRGGPGGPPPALPKIRMHYITANERDNSVLVTGPVDIVAKAKSILLKIDKGDGPKAVPIIKGPPELKIYNVPAGGADAMVKTLSEAYKASATCRISSIGNNKLLVYATPEDQFEIAGRISKSMADTGLKVASLPVGSVELAKAVAAIQEALGEMKTGGPFVSGSADTDAVIIHGSDEQIDVGKKIIEALGGPRASASGPIIGPGVGSAPGGLRMRTIILDKGGSAADLAEMIERHLRDMRKNPVEVSPKRRPESEDRRKGPDARAPSKLPAGVRLVARQDDDPFVDPRRKEKDTRPGNEKMPIRIIAQGNRLLVMSSDPDAIRLVQRLVDLYTAKGEGAFEVIRLRNADAIEAAKALEDVFNNPKEATTPFRPGGFFGGGPGGFRGLAPPAGTPTPDRIRVVAYPATNMLLVRASPLDMLAVRSLLKRALDTDESDARGLVKTRLIGPL